MQDSLTRVYPDLVQQRRSCAISRRVYSVPSSNSLWHIDGLHCLIGWKIVIHGGIDGYSRRIVYLHASSNNRAETVHHLFRGAFRECDWPSRVRSDKGGENIDVARAMDAMRGTGRRSHITGQPTHREVVERHFPLCWITLLWSLLRFGGMWFARPTLDEELFALQYVFLPRINHQLTQFANAWNPLRSENGLGPLQLWNRGLLAGSEEVEGEILQRLQIVDDDYGVDIYVGSLNSDDHERNYNVVKTSGRFQVLHIAAWCPIKRKNSRVGPPVSNPCSPRNSTCVFKEFTDYKTLPSVKKPYCCFKHKKNLQLESLLDQMMICWYLSVHHPKHIHVSPHQIVSAREDYCRDVLMEYKRPFKHFIQIYLCIPIPSFLIHL